MLWFYHSTYLNKGTHYMKWCKPAYQELRFGFEVRMYIKVK